MEDNNEKIMELGSGPMGGKFKPQHPQIKNSILITSTGDVVQDVSLAMSNFNVSTLEDVISQFHADVMSSSYYHETEDVRATYMVFHLISKYKISLYLLTVYRENKVEMNFGALIQFMDSIGCSCVYNGVWFVFPYQDRWYKFKASNGINTPFRFIFDQIVMSVKRLCGTKFVFKGRRAKRCAASRSALSLQVENEKFGLVSRIAISSIDVLMVYADEHSISYVGMWEADFANMPKDVTHTIQYTPRITSFIGNTVVDYTESVYYLCDGQSKHIISACSYDSLGYNYEIIKEKDGYKLIRWYKGEPTESAIVTSIIKNEDRTLQTLNNSNLYSVYPQECEIVVAPLLYFEMPSLQGIISYFGFTNKLYRKYSTNIDHMLVRSKDCNKVSELGRTEMRILNTKESLEIVDIAKIPIYHTPVFPEFRKTLFNIGTFVLQLLVCYLISWRAGKYKVNYYTVGILLTTAYSLYCIFKGFSKRFTNLFDLHKQVNPISRLPNACNRYEPPPNGDSDVDSYASSNARLVEELSKLAREAKAKKEKTSQTSTPQTSVSVEVQPNPSSAPPASEDEKAVVEEIRQNFDANEPIDAFKLRREQTGCVTKVRVSVPRRQEIKGAKSTIGQDLLLVRHGKDPVTKFRDNDIYDEAIHPGNAEYTEKLIVFDAYVNEVGDIYFDFPISCSAAWFFLFGIPVSHYFISSAEKMQETIISIMSYRGKGSAKSEIFKPKFIWNAKEIKGTGIYLDVKSKTHHTYVFVEKDMQELFGLRVVTECKGRTEEKMDCFSGVDYPVPPNRFDLGRYHEYQPNKDFNTRYMKDCSCEKIYHHFGFRTRNEFFVFPHVCGANTMNAIETKFFVKYPKRIRVDPLWRDSFNHFVGLMHNDRNDSFWHTICELEMEMSKDLVDDLHASYLHNLKVVKQKYITEKMEENSTSSTHMGFVKSEVMMKEKLIQVLRFIVDGKESAAATGFFFRFFNIYFRNVLRSSRIKNVQYHYPTGYSIEDLSILFNKIFRNYDSYLILEVDAKGFENSGSIEMKRMVINEMIKFSSRFDNNLPNSEHFVAAMHDIYNFNIIVGEDKLKSVGTLKSGHNGTISFNSFDNAVLTGGYLSQFKFSYADAFVFGDDSLVVMQVTPSQREYNIQNLERIFHLVKERFNYELVGGFRKIDEASFCSNYFAAGVLGNSPFFMMHPDPHKYVTRLFICKNEGIKTLYSKYGPNLLKSHLTERAIGLKFSNIPFFIDVRDWCLKNTNGFKINGLKTNEYILFPFSGKLSDFELDIDLFDQRWNICNVTRALFTYDIKFDDFEYFPIEFEECLNTRFAHQNFDKRIVCRARESLTHFERYIYPKDKYIKKMSYDKIDFGAYKQALVRQTINPKSVITPIAVPSTADKVHCTKYTLNHGVEYSQQFKEENPNLPSGTPTTIIIVSPGTVDDILVTYGNVVKIPQGLMIFCEQTVDLNGSGDPNIGSTKILTPFTDINGNIMFPNLSDSQKIGDYIYFAGTDLSTTTTAGNLALTIQGHVKGQVGILISLFDSNTSTWDDYVTPNGGMLGFTNVGAASSETQVSIPITGKRYCMFIIRAWSDVPQTAELRFSFGADNASTSPLFLYNQTTLFRPVRNVQFSLFRVDRVAKIAHSTLYTNDAANLIKDGAIVCARLVGTRSPAEMGLQFANISQLSTFQYTGKNEDGAYNCIVPSLADMVPASRNLRKWNNCSITIIQSPSRNSMLVQHDIIMMGKTNDVNYTPTPIETLPEVMTVYNEIRHAPIPCSNNEHLKRIAAFLKKTGRIFGSKEAREVFKMIPYVGEELAIASKITEAGFKANDKRNAKKEKNEKQEKKTAAKPKAKLLIEAEAAPVVVKKKRAAPAVNSTNSSSIRK